MNVGEKFPKEKTCCFTGHREDKLHRTEEEIRDELKQEILKSVEEGFTTFITGMAYGVDIWAGELLKELKRKNKAIRLIAAVPFKGFESRWTDRWRWRFKQVLRKADEVHVICEGYESYAYQKRNEWMVDRASKVIAVYNGEPSGTGNTINYAKKAGVPAVYIQA